MKLTELLDDKLEATAEQIVKLFEHDGKEALKYGIAVFVLGGIGLLWFLFCYFLIAVS